MARTNLLLQIVIFIIVFVVGTYVFSGMEGEGPVTSFLYLGESIMGSDLNNDAGDAVSSIVAFIVTAAIYYFVSLIITMILMKIFSRD